MPQQNGNVVRLHDWQSSTECSKYAFEGAVIRITHEQHERWRNAYHAIPDLDACLHSLDEFYSWEREQGRLGNWFLRCSRALYKEHRLHAEKRRDRNSGLVASFSRAIERR